eukprot:COSAG01_NODE_1592_length_9796_cov_5.340311_6_plen_202_part_00
MCLRLSISPTQALAKARARFVGENAQGREGIWEGDEMVRGARSCHLRPLCRRVLLPPPPLLLLPAVCFPGCVQLTARPPARRPGPARTRRRPRPWRSSRSCTWLRGCARLAHAGGVERACLGRACLGSIPWLHACRWHPAARRADAMWARSQVRHCGGWHIEVEMRESALRALWAQLAEPCPTPPEVRTHARTATAGLAVY